MTISDISSSMYRTKTTLANLPEIHHLGHHLKRSRTALFYFFYKQHNEDITLHSLAKQTDVIRSIKANTIKSAFLMTWKNGKI